MKTKIRMFAFVPAIVLAISSSIFAQSGSLSGEVTSAIGDELLQGAILQIKQSKLTTTTNEVGRYKFENLPTGNYTVTVHSDGFADQIMNIRIDGEITQNFALKLQSVNAEVVVTATGREESVYESFSSVNSVGSTRIAERASTGLGDVLENEAGVSKRSFGGPGASRPSIRGFEGDRVMVLQDGARTGSVGAASGDHGEPISSFNLERIEVIKGPATLLYGSNAIGGVVNAITDDKTDRHDGIKAYVTGLGGSVNKQYGGAGGISYGKNNFLLKADLNGVREGDFRSPLGEIPNSKSQAYGGSGNLGYFGDNWYLRGGVAIDRRRYGIPYAALFESREILSIVNGVDCTDEANDCQFDLEGIKTEFANELPPIPDEDIDISMRQNMYRVWGGFNDLDSPIESASYNFDYTDYQHKELEIEDGVEAIGTTFDNDVTTFRTTFNQRKYKRLNGQFGVEGYYRNYLTVGEEQLIDGRVKQKNFAAFTLQELDFDKLSFQFGGRVESNRYNPENANLQDLNFLGFSGAAGIKYQVWKGGSLIGNFSTSFRPPALEELYNLGAHIGTVTFEQGNQNLTRERSNGYEVSLRQNSDRVRFNGSFFYNDIKNFIYLEPQDADNNGLVDVDDGLPIGNYTQADARFLGVDATFEFDINDIFTTFVIADFVNAKLKDSDFYLPRITPARARFGVDIQKGGFSVRPEVMIVGNRPADKVFPLETSTDGYALLNVNAVYTFSSKRVAHILTVGGENLTNKLYRNHVNFLKDLVPERGVGVKFSYSIRYF